MRALDLTFAVLGLAAVGCSAPVVSTPEGNAEASTQATAVVVIERTVSAGDSAHAEAVARFVRTRGRSVDDGTLRMVGAAIDFPSMGSCASLAGSRATELGTGTAVELVNLGTVAVEANGARVYLQPRRLPDVVDLVSGVVYSTRAPAPEALPAEASYILRASGRPELDIAPFAATATAPTEPSALTISGQDARSPSGLVLGQDAPVELTWTAGDPEDLVYVDVAQAATNGPRTVRCLFDDAGRAFIAASYLGEGDGTLIVHRLHRESFSARGIDAGEIRFDFARVVSFRR